MFREANGCADRLARMGADLVVTDFLFLFEPPDVVGEMLASDKAGIVFCNRLVVSYLIPCAIYQKKKNDQVNNENM